MEGNISKKNLEKADIANAFKKKDVKRIRNIIAKYKNKTMGPTTSILYRSKSIDDT
jgi:hypothetical protein